MTNTPQPTTGKNDTDVTDPRIRELLERTVAIYESSLTQSPEAVDYLQNLALNNPGLLSNHQTGFCDGTLDTILPDGVIPLK